MPILPTPALVIDVPILRRNLQKLADYCKQHQVGLRPHTKTHKSRQLSEMQIGMGAIGLTVAKVGEAETMSDLCEDLLLAYPAVDAARCERLAALAEHQTVRVAADSVYAIEALGAAAAAIGSTIGILVDLDVGFGRTGVQTIEQSVALAQLAERTEGVRLDGLFSYPGHIGSPPDQQAGELAAVSAKLAAAIALWKQRGLNTAIVSGGSTPTAYQSHLVPQWTEVRPGTYVFNDLNTAYRGYCEIDDCAARIHCTVVSDAVPGKLVLDAGSKTLTSDRNAAGEHHGYGLIVEYPKAKITRLSEEHGEVDIRSCDKAPKVGERVTVIPNHICPCVNLQDQVWWSEAGMLEPAMVDARGMLT
jgi:D-serine deaminase-like pyridoxal phosphate-dependent protein